MLASRKTPLHGWRSDHFVPTPRVSPPLSAPSPDGGGSGTLRRLLGRRGGQTRRRSSPRLDRTVTVDVTVRSSCGRPVGPASSPLRSSHIASVSPLSRHRSGCPPQDRPAESARQPRNPSTRLANRPYRIDSTGFISALCPQSDGGGRGTLRRLLGWHRGQTRRRSSCGEGGVVGWSEGAGNVIRNVVSSRAWR